jgi:hypothetical protein
MALVSDLVKSIWMSLSLLIMAAPALHTFGYARSSRRASTAPPDMTPSTSLCALVRPRHRLRLCLRSPAGATPFIRGHLRRFATKPGGNCGLAVPLGCSSQFVGTARLTTRLLCISPHPGAAGPLRTPTLHTAVRKLAERNQNLQCAPLKDTSDCQNFDNVVKILTNPGPNDGLGAGMALALCLMRFRAKLYVQLQS